MENNALIVNLFGGPGVGKSTGATYIFSQLKLLGVNCEYISEFAKDKVWEENMTVFKDQNYIFGKQNYRLTRVVDKVDVVITDCPILLSAFYSTDNLARERTDLIVKTFNQYNNLNFLLQREKEYNPIGRMQTEGEAKQIDKDIEQFLAFHDVNYNHAYGTIEGYSKIIKTVFNLTNK